MNQIHRKELRIKNREVREVRKFITDCLIYLLCRFTIYRGFLPNATFGSGKNSN